MTKIGFWMEDTWSDVFPTFLQYATRWTVLCPERLNYQATERLQDSSGIVRPRNVKAVVVSPLHEARKTTEKTGQAGTEERSSGEV